MSLAVQQCRGLPSVVTRPRLFTLAPTTSSLPLFERRSACQQVTGKTGKTCKTETRQNMCLNLSLKFSAGVKVEKKLENLDPRATQSKMHIFAKTCQRYFTACTSQECVYARPAEKHFLPPSDRISPKGLTKKR